MRYFILVKRKGARTWKGAIPAKRGCSKAKIIKSTRRSIKKGLTFKVISQKQIINFLKRLRPKRRGFRGKRRTRRR
jgi:hypothetical protein